MTTFTVYQDEVGLWRWRMVRGNNIIADSGEGYTRKSGAKRAIIRMVGALQIYGYTLGFSNFTDDGDTSTAVI